MLFTIDNIYFIYLMYFDLHYNSVLEIRTNAHSCLHLIIQEENEAMKN